MIDPPRGFLDSFGYVPHVMCSKISGCLPAAGLSALKIDVLIASASAVDAASALFAVTLMFSYRSTSAGYGFTRGCADVPPRPWVVSILVPSVVTWSGTATRALRSLTAGGDR